MKQNGAGLQPAPGNEESALAAGISSQVSRRASSAEPIFSGRHMRHPLRERGADLYETPEVAVHALLRAEMLPLRIWEPCCGPGSIVRVLKRAGIEVVATDINDYGCPDSKSGVDFLMEVLPPRGIDEIAAQLRTLVRHRHELCPAVREFLITKLHLTARRNNGLSDQLTRFAAQLLADFPQHLVLGRDGHAAGQSHNRLSVPNAARIPAPVAVSRRICAPTANARISERDDQTLEGIRQIQEGIS